MTGLLAFCIVFLILYCFFTRVVPRLLAWIVKHRYKIHLRVGHISVPYFIFRDVNVTKNGFTLQIEEISIRSSLLSSDVAKLLAVVMRDVRINKDVPVGPTCKIKQSNELLDFRNKKIPPIIIKCVQFTAVHVENISLLALGNGWLANGNAESLSLDGSIVHGARTLLASASIVGGTMKLLRHASDACLSQITFAGTVEATFKAQGELSVETLCIGVTQTEGSGGAGLIQFLRDRSSLSTTACTCSNVHSNSSNNLMTRIAPILPKDFTLKIGNSLIIAGREDSSMVGLEGTLKSLQVHAKFQANRTRLNFTIGLDGLCVRGKLPILTLHSLSIDTKMEENVLCVDVQLNNLSIMYDHRDWELLLYNNENDISKPVSNISLKDRLPNFEITLNTELYDSSLNIKLPDVQEAFCGVAHMKFALNSSTDKMKNLTTELVIESLYCALNGANSNISETSHQWGSPLSVGVLLATTRSNAIGIAIDALVTEWSLELAKFLEQAYKCYKKCRQPMVKKKDTISRNSIQLNLKVTNCNLFFIAENELSIMMRLDVATVEQNMKRFVCVAEGMSAITLNKNEPIMCQHAQALTHPFLAIRKCKAAINSDAVNISLDGTSLAWSPNLHLRLLQFWVESEDFRSIVRKEMSATRIEEVQKKKRVLDLLATGGITISIDISTKHFLILTSDQPCLG